MKATSRLVLAVLVGVAFLPGADVPAMGRAGCGDIYPAMALGPFHAQTTPPLFYGSEAGSGSFNVQWTGFTCGGTYSVTAAYADAPGSATEPADYTMSEGRTPPVGVVGPPSQETVTFQIDNDGSAELVAEAFAVVLSEPAGGSIDAPPSAPFVVVDAHGLTRVAFDDLPYSQSESYNTLAVPVWLAGSAAGRTVAYTVGPGPGAGATPNDDYMVTSPNPLQFAVGDRVKLITLSVVNDKLSEGDETLQIDLQGAVAPSSKVVTIVDNEENVAPTSRLHHPRHTWRYKKGDYRIREVHVFSHDNPQGSGVTGTQLALRRSLKNGDCAWLTPGGWQKKDCQNREWLDTVYDQTGQLWRYRVKQLKSSVRTKIADYTAYSRAIDGAGNVEGDFKKKRNANTFEIKRGRKRQ